MSHLRPNVSPAQAATYSVDVQEDSERSHLDFDYREMWGL